MTATFEDLLERFAALHPARRMMLLKDNLKEIEVIDPILHTQVKAQLKLKALDKEINRQRRASMRWLEARVRAAQPTSQARDARRRRERRIRERLASAKKDNTPMISTTSNGHKTASIEVPAGLDAVIAEVQREEQPKRQRRQRSDVGKPRTRRQKPQADVVTDQSPALVTVAVKGLDLTGTPQSLAAVLRAM